MKKIIICILVPAILVLSIITILQLTKVREPTKIRHLAYDKNEQFGYTVYIKETDGYKPYLVLTNRYNGNTLLLRKHVLPEIHIFNPLYPNSLYKNYYENSEMDRFINNEYKETLDESVQNKIISSAIVITNKDSLGSTNLNTFDIVRDIFLLSLTEMTLKSYSAAVEGKPLKYFKITENRLASYETGQTESWWLRTPSTYNHLSVILYTYDLRLSIGTAYHESGVRPAFCVDKNEPITTRDDIVPGKVVYVLE